MVATDTAAATALARTFNELVAALGEEATLIDTLRTALERQRAGVAADNPAMLDDSTHAVSRTLLALELARRRRVRITATLTQGASADLDTVEALYPDAVPAAVSEARIAVQRAAAHAAAELKINQTVLRRALDAGDAFLQRLFAGQDDQGGYDVAGPLDPSERGLLLNRTA